MDTSPSAPAKSTAARLLVGLLGSAGIMHFLRPKFFDALIPRGLPGEPRTWTYGSGVAELGVAVAVAVPKTRRFGGLLAALLFLGVFPGNIKMAVDYHRRNRPLPERIVALVRLPLQIPLVVWALKVRSGAE